MMTKKDFNAIAAQLAAARPTDDASAKLDQWRRDVIAIGAALCQVAPNFRWELFSAACNEKPSFTAAS